MASTSTSVVQAKKALRKQIRSQLSELSSSEIERQSREVTNQILNLPEFKEAKRMSVYLSMPGKEISTTEMVKQALGQGKTVFVPHIQKPAESTKSPENMEMFALCSQDDLDSLQRDSWGIPKLEKASLQTRENVLGGIGPSKAENPESGNVFQLLDLILIPGVAFDLSNGRLGHGKGYYDRFLQIYWELASQKHAAAKMPHLVGLALHQQLLPPNSSVPMSTSDWRVDRVITCS